jgi:hypothetical protein
MTVHREENIKERVFSCLNNEAVITANEIGQSLQLFCAIRGHHLARISSLLSPFPAPRNPHEGMRYSDVWGFISPRFQTQLARLGRGHVRHDDIYSQRHVVVTTTQWLAREANICIHSVYCRAYMVQYQLDMTKSTSQALSGQRCDQIGMLPLNDASRRTNTD